MTVHQLAHGRRATKLLPILVGALALAIGGGPGGPPPGAAVDTFVAGQAATGRVRLAGPEAVRLTAAATRSRSLLGAGGAATSIAERVTDRFAAAGYLEVTHLDATGNLLARQRFNAAGRLVAAVRFGWHEPARTTLGTAAAAGSAATRVAGQLGLATDGTPVVRRTAAGEWIAGWQRTVAGVPVRGDGVRLQLWADGVLHLAALTERPLAARPAELIGSAEARRLAGLRLAAWFDAADRAGLRPAAPALAWIAPNDTFDSAAPDAPAAVLRLAWVVEVRTSGALAGRLRAIELYIDAGDGRLLGGDILR